jgi:hypothetical protein
MLHDVGPTQNILFPSASLLFYLFITKDTSYKIIHHHYNAELSLDDEK